MNEEPKKWTKSNVPGYQESDDDGVFRVKILSTVIHSDQYDECFGQSYEIKIDEESVHVAPFKPEDDWSDFLKIWNNWVATLED